MALKVSTFFADRTVNSGTLREISELLPSTSIKIPLEKNSLIKYIKADCYYPNQGNIVVNYWQLNFRLINNNFSLISNNRFNLVNPANAMQNPDQIFFSLNKYNNKKFINEYISGLIFDSANNQRATLILNNGSDILSNYVRFIISIYYV